MNNSPAPVKATGPTATDREDELLAKRIASRERKYQKLLAQIEREQRKVDKADRVFQRGSRMLVQLERQRRRLQLALAKLSAKPEPIEHPRVEAKQEAIADSLVESAANGSTPPAKPKRKPKGPKPTGPEVLTDLLIDAREARKAKMEAAGFRKVRR
jgi:hypothetical protein